MFPLILGCLDGQCLIRWIMFLRTKKTPESSVEIRLFPYWSYPKMAGGI